MNHLVASCPACHAPMEYQSGRYQFVCTSGHTWISFKAMPTTR
jgi:hypothetical protein